MFAVAALLAAGTPMTDYGIYAIKVAPGALPAPALVLALAEPTPLVAVAAITLILLLFPNGKPVSPWWRPVIWATSILAAVYTVGTLFTPHRIVDIWSDSLSHARVSAADPLGVVRLSAPAKVGQAFFPLIVLAFFLGVTSLFVRRRRADATQRAQLRWLAFVVGAAIAWILVMIPLGSLIGFDGFVGSLFWVVATLLVALGIPIAVGIGIVRYRLFDIDVVISKTIVFGALALFIAVVYTAVVVGLGDLLGARTGNLALSIAATALVALAFDPVRRQIQGVANRLVFGDRATPYEVLARFSERVGATYANEDVLARTARVLAEGVAAASATVWLHVGTQLRPEASWPPDGVAPGDPVAFDDADWSASLGADLAVPVRSGDEVLGALAVTKERGDPLTPEDVNLLDDLASQAGLVLENVRLTEDLEARLAVIRRQAEELKASRQRIVSAQDAERRRLERNIHDGAQQHLVALAVKLRLARGLLAKDPPRARAMLNELNAQIDDALETLQTLALGIYPPLLEAEGIGPALAAQYARSGLPVTLESDGTGRYPIETEAAVYFCVLEALQNAAKYADAGSIRVSLADDGDALTFEVTDDGVGFDPAASGEGTGLAGMRDRLAVLGGDATLGSAPGRGTRVCGSLPLSRTAVSA